MIEFVVMSLAKPDLNIANEAASVLIDVFRDYCKCNRAIF